MKKTVSLKYCIVGILIATIVVVVGACGGLGTEPVVMDPQSTQARYELTFQTAWNSSTHGENFPNGTNAATVQPNIESHFTRFEGITHAPANLMWQRGQAATLGVEDIAELGEIARFEREEARVYIRDGRARTQPFLHAIYGLNSAPSVSGEFDIFRTHPLVSMASMVAPSPDWWIGINSLSLLDASGNWVSEMTVPLPPYDAGTEDGNTFTIMNAASEPRGVITRIGANDDTPLVVNGSVPTLGTLTFRRIR